MSDDLIARIIIVAYNSNDVILGCLKALDIQTDKRFEVVIVDNGFPNNPLIALPPLSFPVEIIEPNANLGFASGCNLGAKTAQTPWVIMLNPDTRVAPNWLEQLARSMAAKPEVSVWASTLLQDENPEYLDGFGDVFSIYGVAWRGGAGHSKDVTPKKDVIIFGACGAAAAYKRTIFEILGGFDAAYFCYLEDVDLALRFTLANHTTRISHKAVVKHIGGSSSKNTPSFPIIQTYRNGPYLLIKNLPILALMVIGPIYIIVQIWVIFRNRHSDFHADRKAGWLQGYKRLGEAWAARQSVQRHPKSSRYLWQKLCKSYQKLRRHDLFFIDDEP